MKQEVLRHQHGHHLGDGRPLRRVGLPAHCDYAPDSAVLDRQVSLSEGTLACVNATQELDFMAPVVVDESDVVVRKARLHFQVRSMVEELH